MLHLNDLYRSLRLLSCHYLSDGYSIEFLCINSSVQSQNEVHGQTWSTNSSIKKMQIFKTIEMYLKVTNCITYFLGLKMFSQVFFLLFLFSFCFTETSLWSFFVDYSYFSCFFFFLSGSSLSMFGVSARMLIPGICGSTRDIRIFWCWRLDESSMIFTLTLSNIWNTVSSILREGT